MEDSEKQPFLRTQTSIDSPPKENQNQVNSVRSVRGLCVNVVAHFVLVSIYTFICILVFKTNGYCSVTTSLHRESLPYIGLVLWVTGL